MADVKLTAEPELSVVALDDWIAAVDKSDVTDDAAGSDVKLSVLRLLGRLTNVFQARLTLATGDPHPTTDQTAKTSVFITPYQGNLVSLFDGTRWQLYTLSEVTLALGTLTADRNYDVFLYDNAGTLTGEFSAAWNVDNITRTDALTTQDGVDVKSGATTRRYVGTIRTVTTTTTEDSRVKRFVWNNQNRVLRAMSRFDSTVTWTYTTATYRQANAAPANQLDVVCGKAGASVIEVYVQGRVINSTGGVGFSLAIGEDGTTAHADGIIVRLGANDSASEAEPMPASLRVNVALGRHYYVWLEQSSATGTTTWTGGGGSATNQCGMVGSYWA